MLRRLRLPIADPCHQDWDAMDGEGARRNCEACQTQVTNLSDMNEGDALAFLKRKAGTNICVRYRSDRAGSIRFKVPSVAAIAPTAMGGWRATLAAAGLAAMMLSGCTGQRAPDGLDANGCTYEIGPFEFHLERGQGTCPPDDEDLVMGMRIESVPEPVEMGKVAIIEDPPDVMGEAPIEEIELMGDVMAPEPRVDPVPGPPDAPLMGLIVAPADDVPCDGQLDPSLVSPSKPPRF